MKICSQCKTKYADSLLHCPNCGSMDVMNNPFGFNDANHQHSVIKIAAYGLVRFFTLAIPLVLTAVLSGFLMSQINKKEYYASEMELYKNYVLFNQYGQQMDIYFENRDWNALMQLHDDFYEVFSLWDHYDIFGVILEVEYFKQLIDDQSLTQASYGDYNYTIAHMLEICYLLPNQISHDLTEEELQLLTETQTELMDLFKKVGLDKYNLENIALTCARDGFVDNYCMLERIGD